jgi:hypothetical protein
LVAIIVGLMLSGGLALAAFGARRYDRRPAPNDTWQFGEWQEDEIRLRLLSTRLQALERNRRLLDGKASQLSASLALVAVIALVGSISAIVGLVRS